MDSGKASSQVSKVPSLESDDQTSTLSRSLSVRSAQSSVMGRGLAPSSSVRGHQQVRHMDAVEEEVVIFIDDQQDGMPMFHRAYLPPTGALEQMIEQERKPKYAGDDEAADGDSENKED